MYECMYSCMYICNNMHCLSTLGLRKYCNFIFAFKIKSFQSSGKRIRYKNYEIQYDIKYSRRHQNTNSSYGFQSIFSTFCCILLSSIFCNIYMDTISNLVILTTDSCSASLKTLTHQSPRKTQNNLEGFSAGIPSANQELKRYTHNLQ